MTFGFRRDAQGAALLGGVRVDQWLARAGVQTPAYLYDLDAVREGARALRAAFAERSHLVAYALKANSAGSIVRTLAAEGLGADVVSGAELELALACGVPADRIVMSGVAKLDQEIDKAIGIGIFAIQVESREEIARVAARARALGRTSRVTLRVNPDVAIDAHSHISTGHDAAKFGIAARDVPSAFECIDDEGAALTAVGLSSHIGSMLASTEPYARAARVLAELACARRARVPGLEYLSFGGGFGVDYGERQPEPPAAFVRAAASVLDESGLGDLCMVVEPGRALVAPHGILVARVVQPKVGSGRRFLLIDAGMNDLIRPALYGARHRIEPLLAAPAAGDWRVVGPICESSDDFGVHAIGETPPDYVVIRDAGAYGYVMASEYNGRALPSELFVRGGEIVSLSRAAASSAWVARRVSA